MTFGDSKDLSRRTAYKKELCEKVFNISGNPKYDGYQPGLASTVYNFLIKRFLDLTLQAVVLHVHCQRPC